MLDFITNEQREQYYRYLDGLRNSGVTNMFGAVPYLTAAYNLKEDVAIDVLTSWMTSFNKRHPDE